jgi:hypothetical protein
MNKFVSTTARTALIALIAAAPVSAFAQMTNSSPQSSVAADPQEYAEPDTAATDDAGESKVKSLRETEQPDAEVVDDVDGSPIEDGPRDNG